MNWVPFAVGAGAGALAVLISAGLMRLFGKSSSKGAKVFHFVIFMVALTVGRLFVEPRVQAYRVETVLLDMPVYKALQQHEPEAFAGIRSAVENGIRNKVPKEQIWAITRPLVTEVTAKRLPHASDDVLLKFGQHAVLTTALLHAKGGNACFSYINPQPGEALDFLALLGEEVVQRELNLISEVVSSAAGKIRPAVSESVAASDIEIVVARLSRKYSQDDLIALQNPTSNTVDKRKFCQIVVDMYTEAMALPAPRNSQLLRYLFQAQ